MNKSKKRTFELQPDESIGECLERMAREGYRPTRRIEKPYFIEGTNGPIYEGQMISFEGILAENPNVGK